MRKFAIAALMLTGLTAAPKEVSFPSPDGGVVWGDLYGAGDRAVVLAHGARFNKASWEKQAEVLANAGFRVLAIDFADTESRTAEIDPRPVAARSTRIFWRRYDTFGKTVPRPLA